jgi:hypothetical protein
LTDSPEPVGRPEIPIVVRGPNGERTIRGLVDSGSDHTILPKSVADALGIVLATSPGKSPMAVGGQSLRLLVGRGTIRVEQGGEAVEWEDDLLFHEYATVDDEAVILGHVGFLEFFTAEFDGARAVLTLTPNGLKP